jgi:hypothetical protein
MKNTMLFCGFTLMTIVMFQSCTKDELSNLNTVSSPQEMTFIAGTSSSRTSLQNGTQVWWTAGDAINIFSGAENNKFTTAEGGKSIVTFTGKATPADSYTALYPYNAEALILDGAVTTTLPAAQTAPVWGFDAKANISFATATDENKSLSFQNTCGLIRFKNNLTDLTAIKLTAQGVNIAGNVKIDASGNLTVESGSNVITLSAKEGTFVGPNDANANAKEYSMVVPPVTFTGGFTLELSKTSGNETYTFSGENLTITKGQIVTIELKEGGQPPVVEEQTTAIVASAQEIVTDPTTGNDRVVLTLDKDVAGTFTEAAKSANSPCSKRSAPTCGPTIVVLLNSTGRFNSALICFTNSVATKPFSCGGNFTSHSPGMPLYCNCTKFANDELRMVFSSVALFKV